MQTERVLKQFADQAIACEQLGSPFTAMLCRLIAHRIDARTRFDAHALGLEDGRERMALARVRSGPDAKVLLDGRGVPFDEVPGPLDPARVSRKRIATLR